MGGRLLRVVTHLDVGDEQIEKACAALQQVPAEMAGAK
jgi:hypothetical protein